MPVSVPPGPVGPHSPEETPAALGYRWPAEWEPHAATWLSWPHNQDSWPGKFEPIPDAFARFALTIARFEPVHILAQGAAWETAQRLVGQATGITLHQKATNDCWIRDHGPWFLQHVSHPPALVDWEYNAWGGKYPPFAEDNAVPGFIAETLNYRRFRPGLVMEGGSVEPNGIGDLLVTSQCLLNPNRNPGTTQAEIEATLLAYTGATQVHWLFSPADGSIPGDDTDAHIDQLARFVAPNCLVAAANNPDSPSAAQLPLLDELHARLASLRNVNGEPFRVIPLPLPEPVFYEEHQLPASYANFYVGNGFVIFPSFRCAQDALAEQTLKECFPDREIIGLDAVDLVWGLGAFHCASMQQAQPIPEFNS